jgi:hypothetical protein
MHVICGHFLSPVFLNPLIHMQCWQSSLAICYCFLSLAKLPYYADKDTLFTLKSDGIMNMNTSVLWRCQ